MVEFEGFAPSFSAASFYRWWQYLVPQLNPIVKLDYRVEKQGLLTVYWRLFSSLALSPWSLGLAHASFHSKKVFFIVKVNKATKACLHTRFFFCSCYRTFRCNFYYAQVAFSNRVSVCKLARFQDDLGAIFRPTRKCKLAAFFGKLQGNCSEMAANATPELHENCHWFTLATKFALKNVLYYF